MLKWEKLLNDGKRKEKNDKKGEDSDTQGVRLEAERDYDRILFANPTRRLADKTQVFPLEVNDSVRTRLTHSHEVSNLARSIGVAISHDYAEEVFGKGHAELQVSRKVPSILAAIGLAHDLGNPPFGHQGEVAMRNWFRSDSCYPEPDNSKDEQEKIHSDFLNFDGNPQTFRLLTRLQILNDDFGLNLTYGTLAALVKYPWFSTSDTNKRAHDTKFGVFESERNVVEDVWQNTGLSEGVRHPLTYIMEACDDIAYLVMDAEDTVKKGCASFYDLIAHLKPSNSDPVIDRVIEYSQGKNREFRGSGSLSASELNEISMQMFRVISISELIKAATSTFVSNIESIMNCEVEAGFELMEKSSGSILCESLRSFDRRNGFQDKSVLRLELEGNNYITSTMDMFWHAITMSKSPFSTYATAQISENYRRAKTRSNQSDYYKNCQLIADSMAGMTDGFLILTHNDLNSLYRK